MRSVTPRRAAAGLATLLVVTPIVAVDRSPEIPLVSGMHIVLAVNNHTAAADHERGILQGDYEMVVTISNVTADAVTHTAVMEGTDANGVRRRLAIPRIVTTADLEGSRVQVLGFHSSDPPNVNGTTSLGPSKGVIQSLVQSGESAYSFLNFVDQGMVSGTLRRGAPVRFPVLLNGKRVDVEAILATGHMRLGGISRPFETVILDHDRFPLSLRVAYGPRGGAFPFEPEFQREIVRIDLPQEAPALSAASALEKTCRIEVPGIYFDFNRATLMPESRRGLDEVAAVLRQLDVRAFVIEGHTDNIGSDRYNEELSARRAEAVRSALVRDYGIDGSRLSTAGYGERRPVESNDALSGRARNRRVELACAPSAP